jgi:hypothetical protein
MALAYRLDAISKGRKKSRLLGPRPLPLALVMDAALIKSIMHGARWRRPGPPSTAPSPRRGPTRRPRSSRATRIPKSGQLLHKSWKALEALLQLQAGALKPVHHLPEGPRLLLFPQIIWQHCEILHIVILKYVWREQSNITYFFSLLSNVLIPYAVVIVTSLIKELYGLV